MNSIKSKITRTTYDHNTTTVTGQCLLSEDLRKMNCFEVRAIRVITIMTLWRLPSCKTVFSVIIISRVFTADGTAIMRCLYCTTLD